MSRIRVRIADRLVTLEESALLRAFVDLCERPAVQCKQCSKTVRLTPAQMQAGETLGAITVLCSECADRGQV